MGQSVCRALTADFTATRNIQGAIHFPRLPADRLSYLHAIKNGTGPIVAPFPMERFAL